MVPTHSIETTFENICKIKKTKQLSQFVIFQATLTVRSWKGYSLMHSNFLQYSGIQHMEN